MKEDYRIIRFVLQQSAATQLGVDQFWKRCKRHMKERDMIRSKQNIRQRFINYIVPNIDSYVSLSVAEKEDVK